MPHFVILATHVADQCPTANSKIRQLVTGSAAETPKIASKFGLKILAGPLVATDHRGFTVVEAPNVEAVRKFVLESRLIQWNSAEIIHALPMPEALKELEGLTPIH